MGLDQRARTNVLRLEEFGWRAFLRISFDAGLHVLTLWARHRQLHFGSLRRLRILHDRQASPQRLLECPDVDALAIDSLWLVVLIFVRGQTLEASWSLRQVVDLETLAPVCTGRVLQQCPGDVLGRAVVQYLLEVEHAPTMDWVDRPGRLRLVGFVGSWQALLREGDLYCLRLSLVLLILFDLAGEVAKHL